MKNSFLLFCSLLFTHTLSAVENQHFNFTSDNDIFGKRNFIENKGQFDNSVNRKVKINYAFENGDENIYFTDKGLIYKLTEHYPVTEDIKEELEHGKTPKLVDYHYVNMTWQNCNPVIVIENSEKQNHYITYGEKEFNSSCFKKITYKNVYNGIDFEYTIPANHELGIKYNVIVHPGANVNDIKMVYSGDVKKITQINGDIVIKTSADDIIEHSPKSFYSDNQVVKSDFSIVKNTLSFSFPEGYQKNKTLVIDPWVTTIVSLPTNNYGYDVDYDYLGNTFIFGGYSTFMVAKYNTAGVLVWSFNGTVVSQGWTSLTIAGFPQPGNFVVNKYNSKTYVGQGYANGGNRIVRLDVNGVYDNFITTANTSFQEDWDMGFLCTTGDIYGLGGGVVNNNSVCFINQTTAATSFACLQNANFGAGQDIASHAIDDAGVLFVTYGGSSGTNNMLTRANAAYNGNVWNVPTTYATLCEQCNKNAYQGTPALHSNGLNCLGVNANFLYYYDGFNLAAYNKATGAKIASVVVPGLTLARQAGIAVDDCDNLYLGGNGNIICYKFTGSAFNAQGNIGLNTTATNKYVYDIKMDKPNNVLYVTGSGFVGTYSAANSLNCIVNQYSVTASCNQAVASVTTTMSNPVFSYTWSNTGGTFSTTINSASSTNTVNGLSSGNYTVVIQINAPCGPVFSKTFAVSPPSATITPAAKTCSALGSATATVAGGSGAISYTWTSSVSTTSVATGLSGGTQTLSLSDAGGCFNTFTFVVPFVNTLTTSITGTNVLCHGGTTGSASVTPTGGGGVYTYTWSNAAGGPYDVNLGAGTYSVITADGLCTGTNVIQITEPPALTLTINSSTTNICAGGIINANGFASGGTGPYSFTWTPGPVGSIYNISEAVPGNYNYVLNSTDANGCTITNNINLTFNPIPAIAATSGTICFGDKGVLNASGSETYLWMPVNFSGPTYTVTGTTTMYLTVVGTNTTTGCTSLPVTSTLVVNPLPTPVITSNNAKGCVPVCETFTASNAGGSIQSCNWDFGDGSFASNVISTNRCFTMAGEYTISATVTDNNGCVSKTTTTIETYPIPVADFNYAPLKPIVNNDDVTFTDVSFNAVIKKWDWFFMDVPKPHSNLQNPVYTYMDPGTYAIALLVTSDHGCVDTIVKTIVVGEDYGIYVPNIFSPNGDGVNDIFQPKGFGITKYELRVFNRWGQELMFTNDFFHGWDGLYKGKLSQEDTYIWKINLTNVFGKSHELSGHVTLIK